jgi:hypothetical protein
MAAMALDTGAAAAVHTPHTQRHPRPPSPVQKARGVTLVRSKHPQRPSRGARVRGGRLAKKHNTQHGKSFPRHA